MNFKVPTKNVLLRKTSIFQAHENKLFSSILLHFGPKQGFDVDAVHLAKHVPSFECVYQSSYTYITLFFL